MRVAHAPFTQSLKFTGTIEPLSYQVIASPADGNIVQMKFQYGDLVNAGDVLFIMESSKFLQDYKTALADYIKTKNELNAKKNQFNESKFLLAHELVSKDEFKTKESEFYTAQLGFLQAQDALDVLIRKINLDQNKFHDLVIDDIQKITKALHFEKNSETLPIRTPVRGLVLTSPKDGSNKKLLLGDSVKQGDVLVVIGNMEGLHINIQVNELTINQLKINQAVKVSGLAFPDLNLHGFVSHIDKQGENKNNGLPLFNVEIVVPKLKQAEQEKIHIGMSSEVEIDIPHKAQILIPIKNIIEKDGKAYVYVYDKVQRKKTLRLVTTGNSTSDAVAITSGIKDGEEIIVSS